MKSRHTLLLLSSCILLSLGTTAFGADETVRKLEQIAAGTDIEANRTLCQEILYSDPQQYALHFCEGYEAIFLGIHDEVRRRLNRCLDEQPEFGLAALLYGRAYEELGDDKKAEFFFQRAIETQPRRLDLRNELGRFYLKQARNGADGRYADALEAFRQMAQANPNLPAGFTQMGIVLTEMGRLEDAQNVLEKALAKDPEKPSSYDNLAAIHARRGDLETATNFWQQAWAIDPNYGEAVVELSNLHGRRGEIVEAMAILRRASETMTDAAWTTRLRRNLGFAFLAAGDPVRARDTFQAALISGSQDALTFLGLGHVRMMGGLTAEAIDSFRRGVALDATASVPFLEAWKATLEFAVTEGEVGPLAETLSGIQSGDIRSDALKGASGPDASTALARFVLGDWDLSGASSALQEYSEMSAKAQTSGFDQAPTPIDQFPADYPEWAREQGLEGDVKVKVTVDETGKVVEATVASSEVDPSLADSAVEAAAKWTFVPASRFGEPVEATIIIPFRFRNRD